MTESDLGALAADLSETRLSIGDHAEGVATLTIDRPEARNALNKQVRREVKRVMGALDAAPEVRVVVLTGAEEAKAFVAGADVSELRERGPLDQREAGKRPRIYEAIAESTVPVIGRINGHALGGGCELAQACDIRIASEYAKLGQPEVTLGLMPGGGATQRLPRLIGMGQTLRLVLSGELIDAEEAARIGLVDEVCPHDALDERVYTLAEMIASNGPLAVEMARRAVYASTEMPLSAGIEYEAELFNVLFDSADKNEGIDAFFEDRDPEWTGR